MKPGVRGRQLDGREDWIRTSGLLLPKQALYQAELPPDEGSVDGTEGRAGGAPRRASTDIGKGC